MSFGQWCGLAVGLVGRKKLRVVGLQWGMVNTCSNCSGTQRSKINSHEYELPFGGN